MQYLLRLWLSFTNQLEFNIGWLLFYHILTSKPVKNINSWHFIHTSVLSLLTTLWNKEYLKPRRILWNGSNHCLLSFKNKCGTYIIIHVKNKSWYGQLSKINNKTKNNSKRTAWEGSPEKYKPSFPVILATEPCGATFPYNIWMWAVFLMGFSIGLIISWITS